MHRRGERPAVSYKAGGEGGRAFIVRIEGGEGTFTTADVRFFDGAKSVKITNMLEEEQSEVESIAPAKLQFRPFEIKTLKVTY